MAKRGLTKKRIKERNAAADKHALYLYRSMHKICITDRPDYDRVEAVERFAKYEELIAYELIPLATGFPDVGSTEGYVAGHGRDQRFCVAHALAREILVGYIRVYNKSDTDHRVILEAAARARLQVRLAAYKKLNDENDTKVDDKDKVPCSVVTIAEVIAFACIEFAHDTDNGASFIADDVIDRVETVVRKQNKEGLFPFITGP